MELKEFISETLTQIAEGVKKAQTKTAKIGCYICPKNIYNKQNPQGYRGEVLSIVDFEVGIKIEENKEGKKGIGIMVANIEIGANKKDENKNASVLNIKFNVPVLLPTSDNPTEK